MLQAQRSLQILHRHFLTVDVDVRYRRSVELFTMQMIHHKLDIQAGGLYPIDYTMLYSVGIRAVLIEGLFRVLVTRALFELRSYRRPLRIC